jgi:hypothetical protein
LETSTTLAIYIELKGGDISHAANQLDNSLRLLGKRHPNASKQCIVVASRFPKAAVDVQITKKRFMEKWKASFKVKNVMMEITV